MEDTKYKIETTDKNEMGLMLGAVRMAGVLYDIISWRNAVYNGKDYDGSVIYKGRVYTKSIWENMDLSNEERDERGLLKEQPVYCYTEEDLDNKLNELLEDVIDLVNTYYR